ncbi:MAG: transglutaminase family protein, partial [Verrucomicrobiota bacterium]
MTFGLILLGGFFGGFFPQFVWDCGWFGDVGRVGHDAGIDEIALYPSPAGKAWQLDPLKLDLKQADERRRVAKLIERGLGEAAGYVLPLKALPRPADASSKALARFRSSPWPLRHEHLYLIPGDSPLGLRLPLASLPWVAEGDKEEEFTRDPFDTPEALPNAMPVRLEVAAAASPPKASYDPHEIIHTALCAEVRNGVLCVFLPPVPMLEDFVTLLTAIETTAADLKLPLRLEGYT